MISALRLNTSILRKQYVYLRKTRIVLLEHRLKSSKPKAKALLAKMHNVFPILQRRAVHVLRTTTKTKKRTVYSFVLETSRQLLNCATRLTNAFTPCVLLQLSARAGLHKQKTVRVLRMITKTKQQTAFTFILQTCRRLLNCAARFTSNV